MKFCRFVAVLLLTGLATVANAEDYLHKASGLQFELPKGWTSTEEDGRLTITNNDKSVWLVGGVIEKEAAEAIFDDIESFVDKLEGLDDVEVANGPEKEEVNGLEQAWYDGTATVKGDNGQPEEIEWDMTVVTGGRGVLFLVGMGKLDDNEEVYEHLFESIHKAGESAE